MKCGFIAIVGRPNTGKSSLLNCLIGEKISIVSPKAQTTRDRITGILTEDGYQMVFLDTPGYHKPRNELGNYMEREIKNAAKGVDAILVLLDASKKFGDAEVDFVKAQFAYGSPVYVAINKVDLVNYEKVFPMMEKLAPLTKATPVGVKEIVPISALKGNNIELLKQVLRSECTEEGAYYPEDELSDRSQRFMTGEIIREKALLLLNDEIPHGVGVSITKMEFGEKIVRIEADIFCEKDTHKQIIIGEGGAMIKHIGASARRDIEKLLGQKIYLELFVKVRENWRDRKNILNDIGYNLKNDN